MRSASYGLIFLFLAAGCALGWFGNRSLAAHVDVKVTKAKLPGYRKIRHRTGILALVLALVIGVVVFNVIHPHP